MAAAEFHAQALERDIKEKDKVIAELNAKLFKNQISQNGQNSHND